MTPKETMEIPEGAVAPSIGGPSGRTHLARRRRRLSQGERPRGGGVMMLLGIVGVDRTASATTISLLLG
jgi:hypothetical protein